MTANGTEIRFWLYLDTTNQSRLIEDTPPAWPPQTAPSSVQFDSDGNINVLHRPHRAATGYTTGRLHPGGHLHDRLDPVPHRLHLHRHGRPDLHAVQARSPTDPWTQLKSAGATGYAIPMRGTNTITTPAASSCAA